jgi:hypothetical protein
MNHAKRQRGATLIEASIVIVVVSLVFFGLLQVSLLINASQVLDFAAFTAARSKTVGFHDGIVYKAFRVSNIPNAGKMLVPATGLTQEQQLAVEKQRIPWYLQDIAALDYQYWQDISMIYPVVNDDALIVATQQRYPMNIPMYQAFYPRDHIWLEGRAQMENHYPYYLWSR